MRVTPGKGYHWILHIKDHFSKYSFLYPLTDKTAAGVAKCIAQWLGIVEIPRILQCQLQDVFVCYYVWEILCWNVVIGCIDCYLMYVSLSVMHFETGCNVLEY